MQTTAINLKGPESFMVTWEMLKKCNLDCTYCESTRHDNDTDMPSIKELKSTFDFIRQYTDLYNSKRLDNSKTNINFTGGEPTINNAFWELLDYIKQFSSFELGLTTNGTWGSNFTDRVVDNFKHVTVSWHAEADKKLKGRSLENIIELHNRGVNVQANIMLHVDYFDEAAAICEYLNELGIKVHPTPVGDGNILKKGWFLDNKGTMRRTSHEYSAEQQGWFYKFKGIEQPVDVSQEGTNVGRACCGGRCLTGKVDGEWKPITLVNTFFKDWYCTVNWYFLHIDQYTRKVFHHQTCQATFDGRGPIGSLDTTNDILNNLKLMLSQPSMKPIVCPNQRCGCGMCVPKAKEIEDFKLLWKATTTLNLNK
jgi:MoaA/NifB/PqqE/SkfB family radical SAM enzyme